MTTDDQEFWEWAAPLLRQAYGYQAMEMAAIGALLDSVGEEELPPEHITEMKGEP